MNKIIIIGVTGSGKSTLAKKLAEAFNYPYIQLDKLFWKPNWAQSSDEELFEKIHKSIDCDSWIIDGNYERTKFITWEKADTVIWIDLPFFLTLYQSVTRSFYRGMTRVELWDKSGNRESFFRMISKDSVIRWLFKTYKPHKLRNEAYMKDDKYKHIKFYRLRSRKEIKRFITSHTDKSSQP